ncbi:MAG: hypothetical protein A2Z14_12015 [Chloroflexi bacterium RBG_16_48_8]|nr:MAG: hypothetical protein A2Z14_12015 [Chloroflexi bacterium RBG_16_48_8]
MIKFLWKVNLQAKVQLASTDMIWRKSWIFTLFLLIVTLISSGCTLFNLPDESGVLLFQDDFSSPNSGWNRYRGETYISDYADGAYRIAVFEKDVEAWALPGLNFSDVIVEVAGTSVNGPEDNVFGVLCRYRDSENFYFFVISSDGYSGIGLFYEGKRELLTGESMLPSNAILKGSTTNLIKAQCVGNQLSLYVNGSLVNQAGSDKLKSGDVGLIAGNYEDGKTEVFFDHFSVKNP